MEFMTRAVVEEDGLANERAREHWVMSLLEGPDGDLVPMLSPDVTSAEVALLSVVGSNAFVWEAIAFALAFLLEAQGCPREFLS